MTTPAGADPRGAPLRSSVRWCGGPPRPRRRPRAIFIAASGHRHPGLAAGTVRLTESAWQLLADRAQRPAANGSAVGRWRLPPAAFAADRRGGCPAQSTMIVQIPVGTLTTWTNVSSAVRRVTMPCRRVQLGPRDCCALRTLTWAWPWPRSWRCSSIPSAAQDHRAEPSRAFWPSSTPSRPRPRRSRRARAIEVPLLMACLAVFDPNCVRLVRRCCWCSMRDLRGCVGSVARGGRAHGSDQDDRRCVHHRPAKRFFSTSSPTFRWCSGPCWPARNSGARQALECALAEEAARARGAAGTAPLRPRTPPPGRRARRRRRAPLGAAINVRASAAVCRGDKSGRARRADGAGRDSVRLCLSPQLSCETTLKALAVLSMMGRRWSTRSRTWPTWATSSPGWRPRASALTSG